MLPRGQRCEGDAMSKSAINKRSINDHKPNFRDQNNQLFLIRCFNCGRENWAPTVATGVCAWCGWADKANTPINKANKKRGK